MQNQVDAAGNVVGGELLMRWDHPVRGNVPPSRFIPIAEASGLILRMGDWMIQQACETLARLQAAGHALSLSVNVSERQFRQDDFVERVRHILAHTGANPALLILEVTESLLIEDLGACRTFPPSAQRLHPRQSAPNHRDLADEPLRSRRSRHRLPVTTVGGRMAAQ